MHKVLCALPLFVWVAIAQAIPMKPSDEMPDARGLTGMNMGNAQTSVPAEILEKLSGPDTANLPQAVLVSKSAELRKRLVKSPGNPMIMHALGTVLFQQGGVKEAMALWGVAHNKDADLAPADVMRDVQEVFALLARNDKANAQKNLAAAEKRYANQPHFQLLRAEQAMRGGNAKAAEQAYRRAYELAPKLYVTSLNLARFYDATRGDAAVADRLFQEAAKLAPKRAEVWAHYGVFQFRQKQTKAAQESLRKARILDPAMPRAEMRMAELSIQAGDLASAREWYRSALAGKPSREEARAIHAALGDVLLRLGKPDEARLEIETALKERELAPLVFALGTIDEAEGKLDAAERRYRRVLALMNNNPLAANNLAMLLVKTGKGEKEALKLAEQANRAIPNNAIIQGTYGCALQHAGRNAEAVKVLGPVVAATPKDAWSRYCLGKSLVAEKRVADARNHLQQVLRDDPKFPRRAEIEKLAGAR